MKQVISTRDNTEKNVGEWRRQIKIYPPQSFGWGNGTNAKERIEIIIQINPQPAMTASIAFSQELRVFNEEDISYPWL